MKIRVYMYIMLSIAAWLFYQSPVSGQVTYCAANGKIQYYEYIDYISIGTIARTSGAEAGGYFNGTALSTDMVAGSTYTFTYSHANPVGGYTENWSLYIDWNRDGDFLDAGETALSATSYTTVNYTTPITVPLTATPGLTRMRVCMESGLYPFPASCGKFQYGEVEDYTLNILGGAICTESYEPNNTKASAKPIAVNTAITSQISIATDIDWLSFTNSVAASNIQIALTTLPANYNMRLYDPSGLLVGTSALPGLTSETITYNTATIGTYKIKIYGAGGAFNAANCYTITANTAAGPFRTEGESAEQSPMLLVYPVPAFDQIHVQIAAMAAGNAELLIYNTAGSIVYQENLMINEEDQIVTIPVGDLVSGVYMLQLTQKNTMAHSQFVIAK